ncbi:uncharacterized protein [Dysidea avara]|uniref:uncharacterized protein n=1 Tax=Dysidea avara TaxID=196820 RepID=UPI0033183E57
MEEDLLQPHSAENLAGEELEESLLSHEEEVDTQNSTVVDASQKLNQGPSVQASITSNVPDYLEGWEENFTAPTQFSERTMGVLSSGLMSKSARAEITQATTAKMLNFCKYPTADQYNIVAKKIVTNLLNGKKDSTGTGFGSWAKGLETRFRNIRRKPRSSSIGLEFSPPTKKKKIGIHSCPQSSALLDDATYDLHLKELEKQLSKKTKSKSALSSLMYGGREGSAASAK